MCILGCLKIFSIFIAFLFAGLYQSLNNIDPTKLYINQQDKCVPVPNYLYQKYTETFSFLPEISRIS